MARIKELRLKVKEGTATPEEEAELKELEEEAAVEEDENNDEAKAITDLANKLIATIEAKTVADKIVEEKTEEKETGYSAELKAMSEEDQAREFIKALVHDDQAKLKVMSTTSADGGYLIPTVLYNQVVEEMREGAVVRPVAKVISNCPAHLDIDQLIGRPKANWTAEKAIKDTTTATFDQISLTPYTLATIVVLTNQVIEDAEASGNLITYMTEKLAEAINEKEDAAFATGDGSGKPTGIDTYNATIHRTRSTAANVLTADSLVDAFMALGPRYRKNAYWFMNTLTLTKARQLKDGQNRYLFNDDVTGDYVGTILGRPVLEQNNLPLTRIWFGDFSRYWIGDRHGINVAKSTEATIDGVGNLFERNMTAIRVEKRVDGELVDLDAFVCLSGTN